MKTQFEKFRVSLAHNLVTPSRNRLPEMVQDYFDGLELC